MAHHTPPGPKQPHVPLAPVSLAIAEAVLGVGAAIAERPSSPPATHRRRLLIEMHLPMDNKAHVALSAAIDRYYPAAKVAVSADDPSVLQVFVDEVTG